MLRIAVPNKGTLAQPAAQMLQEAGYRQRSDPKDLLCRDEPNGVEFFYLRPRDIATYVGSGDLDLGITGRDLLVDAGSPAVEVLDLGFGRATIRFAAVPGSVKGSTPADLEGLRVATAYPGVVERYLAEHEGPVRTAEELSQLLYQVQCLMLATGLSLEDVYRHL